MKTRKKIKVKTSKNTDLKPSSKNPVNPHSDEAGLTSYSKKTKNQKHQNEFQEALHHCQKMRQDFKNQIQHLRKDIKIIKEPQCKAMFETAAEVLNGLLKAFKDYERQNEAAWTWKGK